MEIGRSDVRHTQRDHTASLGRHGVWAPGAKPIWASGDVPRQQAGNTTAIAPITKSLQKTSCIQGPFSNRASFVNCLLLAAVVLLLSPYRGHGSLRGRRLPPQHLVRSTGAAMSTTGSRGNRAAQRPPSQLACTLAPVGQLVLAPACDAS
jgi:hypothetical protein